MRPIFGVIGVPTFGTVSIKWAMNFHHLGVGLAVYVMYYTPEGKRVDIAKEEIVDYALRNNAEWIFFLDDDVIPPPNALMKMIKLAYGPPFLDVINGVYYSKSDPPLPLLFRGDMKGSYWNWHCLPGYEKIITARGPVPIESVLLKDRVLTHKSRFQPLKAIYRRPYRGKMYHIRVAGLKRPVSLTKGHPVWIKNKNEYKWLPVEQLTRQHNVIFPLLKRGGDAMTNHLILPIANITVSDYRGDVFNLGVEKDESYTTEGFVVHNCGDLIEIDAAGFGCTFIKTKVFRDIEAKIGRPFFSVDYTYNPILAGQEAQAQPSIGATEDLYCYKKIRQCGYKIYADTSIQCLHEDRMNKIYYGLPPDYPQNFPGSEIKPRGKKLILDIGSGERSAYFPEGTPVRLDFDPRTKPDILADFHNIPEPDLKYDIVYGSHVLEHVSFRRARTVLKEWLRVLKIGGEIRLCVPNLEWAAERILDGTFDKGPHAIAERVMFMLYSAQKDEKDYHLSGFTPNTLKKLLESVGCLKKIKVWTSNGNFNNWRSNPGIYNILATAIKYKHLPAASIVDPALQNYSPDESEIMFRKEEDRKLEYLRGKKIKSKNRTIIPGIKMLK